MHMIFVYDLSSQDRIYLSSEINNNSAPNEGIQMKVDGDVKLDFVLMVNNVDFDNDDNPYGKFVYHMYSNMDNLQDTSTSIESNEDESIYKFEDRFIPLIICPSQSNTSWRKSDVKQYCPDYSDHHFLYGNFYTKRFSWLRLALHFCDDTP